jgi:hypothetical protein
MIVDAIVWLYDACAHWFGLYAGVVLCIHLDGSTSHTKNPNQTERLDSRVGDDTLVFSDFGDVVPSGYEIQSRTKQLQTVCGVWARNAPRTWLDSLFAVNGKEGTVRTSQM